MRSRWPSLLDRFWANVQEADGCWPWTGAKFSNGYGRISSCGKTILAHRLAWEIHHRQPVPDDLEVLHDCPAGDNRACVNPAHFWLGTQADNIADMRNKGRSCYGERNGMSKLTQADVDALRRRRTAGERMMDLAAAFKVSVGTVWLIVTEKTWRVA